LGRTGRGERHKKMIQIVTVVNNFDVFNSTIRENRFMNAFPIHLYDNTRDNIGISRRYNDFIENHMQADSWVVFCHQDFGFEEDVSRKVHALDKNCIYGPVGTAAEKQLVFIFALGRYGFERFRLGIYRRAVTLGQITQKTAEKTVRMGRYLKRPMNVDTVDCCCMIIHSSLIARKNLRFDQALDWHLYVEDFCLGAKYHHDILTKSVQLNSIHYSSGNVNFDFLDKLTFIKKKYKTETFSTTCYDGYKRF